MDDYVVRLIELPIKIGGLVALSEDGFTNIYINSLLDSEQQFKSLRHELKHIKKEHLYSKLSVSICEKDATQGE